MRFSKSLREVPIADYTLPAMDLGTMACLVIGQSSKRRSAVRADHLSPTACRIESPERCNMARVMSTFSRAMFSSPEADL